MGTNSPFLLITVLLVAPSASLAGPVPAPAPAPEPSPRQAILLPWGQGIAGAGAGGVPVAPGGFIYCAGCSPINPQQLVLPSNTPFAKSLPVISASGVLPPSQIPKDLRQLNILGSGGNDEPGKTTVVASAKAWEDDGSIPVQQMALHDDGRYSFSYNTADSTRQEERNLDGSVSGSYSYTDPNGKLVTIDYTAGPQGYKAYGENVPPTPVFQLPQPVRETPEVQEAREKFLQAYASELARHQQESDTAHGSSTVAPSDSAVSSESPSSVVETDEGEEATTMNPSSDDNGEGEVLPLSAQNDQDDESHSSNDDAVIVSGKSETGHEGAEGNQEGHEEGRADDQSDSVVISADEPAAAAPVNVNLPDPSYQINIPVGVGPHAQFSIQSGPQHGQKSAEAQPMPVMQDQMKTQLQSNLQPYFYYVSVGGSPHFVSAPSIPGYNSPYPTSLKASLLGAYPLAAVHDTQVPNRGSNNMMMNMPVQSKSQSPIRPIYLDLGNSVQENVPSQNLQMDMNNMNMNMGQMQMQQQVAHQYPSLVGNNQLNFNNPLLGQLVPIQLSPLGTHQGAGGTFAYIPGLILNNGGMLLPAQQQQQQQQQGSQPSNVVQYVSNFNVMPEQQQPQQQQQDQQVEQIDSSAAPASDEPEIVLASKK